MSDNQACQVPFVELLKGVPADALLSYEHNPTSHSMFPVGRYCHEAATEIERLSAELAVANKDVERMEWVDQQTEYKSHRPWQDSYSHICHFELIEVKEVNLRAAIDAAITGKQEAPTK